MASGDPIIRVRLPQELKAFIEGEARYYVSSQNSVIVRAVREMKQRAEMASDVIAAHAEARRRERAAETKARTLDARERTDETSPA
ncbi:hypothetical protein RUR49_19050 [Pseudoxanthobacter sp. M-2]|uniref:hypothetical protein n=1 Tax=Pseudoxanthobacter sp. M-2 TaxID=3078754 RepID=UPI0038FC4218